MKILVVCQYYYPEQFKINDICEELIRRGHEVRVLTGLPNYPEGRILKEYRWFKNRNQIINGVKVRRASLFSRGKTKLKLMINYFSFAYFASIEALFMKKDFDLIYVYQLSPVMMALPAIMAKKLSGKKLFLCCQDLWPQSLVSGGVTEDSKIYGIIMALSKWIYRKVDFIAVSSRMFGQYFSDVLGIEKKVAYIPMYAENLFENIKSRDNPDGKFHLLFAGNLGEMQDVGTIINAARYLKDYKDIHFDIVGSGSKEEQLREMASGLENITFHGRFPLEDMPGFYEKASAFLITLKDDKIISYTLPNKMQSYMSAGKPVFGAINGESNKIINDEAKCGVAVRSGDSEGLAKAICEYYKNDAALKCFSENALDYYSKYFCSDKYFEYFLNWIQENLNL